MRALVASGGNGGGSICRDPDARAGCQRQRSRSELGNEMCGNNDSCLRIEQRSGWANEACAIIF